MEGHDEGTKTAATNRLLGNNGIVADGLHGRLLLWGLRSRHCSGRVKLKICQEPM
jgi:hypothetical protein